MKFGNHSLRFVALSCAFIGGSLSLVRAQQQRRNPAPAPKPAPVSQPVQIFGPSQSGNISAPPAVVHSAPPVRRGGQAAKLFDSLQQSNHTVVTLDGNRIPLNNLFRDDRPNVAIIWSSYCEVCQTGIADWEAIYERFGQREANVLALSVQPAAHREQVKNFMRAKQLSYPVYFASRELYGQITEGNFGTPTTFVFAADGTLAARLIGWTSGQGHEALANAIRRAASE